MDKPYHPYIHNVDDIYTLRAGSLLYSPGSRRLLRWQGKSREELEAIAADKLRLGQRPQRIEDLMPVLLVFDMGEYALDPEPDEEYDEEWDDRME